MKPLATSMGLALALASGPAAAQDAAPQNDCEFLEQSFQEVYDGMRAMAGSEDAAGQGAVGQGHPDPSVVTMFVAIQNNIILLHEARGCDASRLVDLARQEKERYGE